MIRANRKPFVPSRIYGYLRLLRAITRNNSLTRDFVERFVHYPQWKGIASLSNQLPVKVAFVGDEYLGHILDYLTAQQGVNICPIIGTHGFSAPETARQRAAALGIEVEYVTKMDDDDLYGPYYLSEALHALQYSGAEMVGKHSRFIYLGNRDLTVLRFANKENRFSNFISGSTIFTRERTFKTIKFAEKRCGEDSDLLRRLLRQGGRIYSTSRLGFVLVRDGSQGSADHTHQADSTEFIKASREIYVGHPDEREIPEWEMTS